MADFEYRCHLVSIERGALLLMASAVSLENGVKLRKLVTATRAEGEAVLERRVRIAIDDELRRTADTQALQMHAHVVAPGERPFDEA